MKMPLRGEYIAASAMARLCSLDAVDAAIARLSVGSNTRPRRMTSRNFSTTSGGI